MKKRKILSIFISFLLIFTVGFTAISQAVEKSNYSPKSTNFKVGNYIYYSVLGDIYKVNVKTNKKTKIKRTCGIFIYDITVKDGWIYCTVDKEGVGGLYDPHIYKVRTNGKDGKFLGQGFKPIVYKNKIYYIKLKGDPQWDLKIAGLYKMSLSGKNVTSIKKASEISDFIVYKSNIYYISCDNNKYYLNKTTLSGKLLKKIKFYHEEYGNLKVYSNYIYFDYRGGVYKIKTNLTSKSKVLSNASLIDVSNNYIYYSNSDSVTQNIYKMNLNNKKKKFIYGDNRIDNIYVCNGYIIMSCYLDAGMGVTNDAFKGYCDTNGNKFIKLQSYHSYGY